MCLHFAVNIFYLLVVMVVQANMKLNEQQLASLSSKKAVDEYLLNQKENITHMIKQSLAVGDIYKRENLQVINFVLTYYLPIIILVSVVLFVLLSCLVGWASQKITGVLYNIF